MVDPIASPAADLARRTGDVLATAAQPPVVISKHKKPRFVPMSVQCFEALSEEAEQNVSRSNPRHDSLEDSMISASECSNQEFKEDCGKPSDAFDQVFGEEHGVDLPSRIHRGYRPLAILGSDD